MRNQLKVLRVSCVLRPLDVTSTYISDWHTAAGRRWSRTAFALAFALCTLHAGCRLVRLYVCEGNYTMPIPIDERQS